MSSDLEKIITLIQSRDTANVKIAVEILRAHPELEQQAQQYYNPIINLVGVTDILEMELAMEKLSQITEQHSSGVWDSLRLKRHHYNDIWKTVKALKSPLFSALLEVWCENIAINQALIEAILQLEELVVVRLTNCHITLFTKQLCSIHQLVILDLTKNEITELPDEITQLSTLHELILVNNQLTQLPENIGKLQKLQLLNVSGSRIETIPDSLYDLHELRELNFDYNWGLSYIDDKITNLKKLTSLSLDCTRIYEDRKEELRALLPHCEIR